jgi:peptide/nickel transport system substrate-binding protein
MKKIIIFKQILTFKKPIDFFIILSLVSSLIFLFLYFHNLSLNKIKYGGIYKEGLFEIVDKLNPLNPLNETEKAILKIIYPPLIEFDNGKIFSKFIQSYNFSPDKTSLIIELKKNIKWSDGSEINTKDIEFSFNLLKKFASLDFQNNFKNVNLNIIDDKKFEFILELNNNYFFYNLNNLQIFPKHVFINFNPENFDTNFLKIGSGPFILKRIYKKNNIKIIELEKNKFYNPSPYLNGIIFYVFPSAKSAYQALLSKQIDGLAGINYIDFPNKIKIHNQINKILLPRIIGIFFNQQKVNKNNIIENLNFSIDRNLLNKKVFNNYGEISYSLLSPTIKKILNLNENINKKDSKLNLIENKNNNQIPIIKITVVNSYFYPEIARYLKENLKNFKIDLEFIEIDQLSEILNKKDYEAILFGINYSYPPSLSPFFSKLGYNINNVENLELEKKFNDLLNNSQINITQKIKEIEDYLNSLKINIFLINPYYIYIINKKIKGFNQFFLTKPEDRFNKIEFWYKK